jgi:hypothetical protein
VLERVDAASCACGDRLILLPQYVCEPWASSFVGRIGTLQRPCGALGAAAGTRWVAIFADPDVIADEAAELAPAGAQEAGVADFGPCPCMTEPALVCDAQQAPQREEATGAEARQCITLVGVHGPWMRFGGAAAHGSRGEGRDCDERTHRAAGWGVLGETLLVAKRNRVGALKAFCRALDALSPGNVGSAGAGGAGWREASLQVRADVLFRCAQLEHTLQGDLLKSEQLYLQALAQVEGEDPAEAEGGGRGGRDLDADIVAGYARLLADDGVMQLGRAEVLLRRVLIQEPSHPQALLAYAALLLDSGGSLSQAETMIEQVLLDNASDPQGIAAYGTFAACVMGDYGIAEGLYRSALALDPGDVATHSQKSSI